MTVRPLKPILAALFVVSLAAGAALAGTYENSSYGFTFEYPDKYSVDAESENRFTLRDKDGDAVLTGDVEDIKHYPRDLYAGYSDPFEKFGTWRALLRCDADGPDGSAYCPSLDSIERFSTRNGFRALELMPVHVRETMGDKPTTEETVTGPLYLVDVSHEGHTVVLMLGTRPDEQMTNKQKNLAASILDTIKFAK